MNMNNHIHIGIAKTVSHQSADTSKTFKKWKVWYFYWVEHCSKEPSTQLRIIEKLLSVGAGYKYTKYDFFDRCERYI